MPAQPPIVVTPPPRPALALPPRPALRRGLWALPLVISLAFVAGVLAWLRTTEQEEREMQRTDLISDALSLQTQVSARIDHETELLAEFASRLDRSGDASTAARSFGAEAFAAAPEVQQGLHRFWISLTWLDASNRIVVHVPDLAPADFTSRDAAGPAASGLSAHLRVPLASGGALIARYSPTEMLRQNVPWWLARKYDVRLIDSAGSVIASTTEARDRAPGNAKNAEADAARHPGQSPAQSQAQAQTQSHRIGLEPALADSYLELIARDAVPPWYRSLPVAMIAGFVVLIAAITWMLRRQVRDVSRAEAAWRTEAAWRSAMEDSLTIGLRARDLDGRLVYVNRTFADMVGYAPEALVGLLPPMPYWPPDAIDESMGRHRRNMAGDAPRSGYETRWRHAVGRAIDVILFEAPLVDASGRHIGWMGSVLDITAAKRLEDRERRQTDTMAHHARLTMLGEIASTLAHELNQPLSAISSYNAGVMNSLQRAGADGAPRPAPDPAVLRALQRLGEQAAHAGRIVQRIRQFLTRREPQLEPCSINAVVEGGVDLLRRELARQQVQITLVLAPGLPPVIADAVLIEQVVINLVRNACDALIERPPTDDRPRLIEARTVDADGSDVEGSDVDSADVHAGLDSRCGQRLEGRARRVRVEVRDNGPGLQGRRIEDLCAPFYSTKAEGMGMGLAICRSILEAHHGAIDAVEAPGGGAWFSLSLPLDLRVGAAALEETA